MRRLYLLVMACAMMLTAHADGGQTLADIRRTLVEASSRQVQEKVYVHTDNTCYFAGDTIWYKAYVVRADDLGYTDMSRVLYVELLSPDGLVTERQRIIVSDRGYSCGNFCLPDSMQSGYYEMRAYTRWMLNFNVTSRRYSRNDTHAFYSRDMAADFYRQWEGLYSRVLPIYSHPDTAGDYTSRRIGLRHRQNVMKAARKELRATFYPEGGHLIEGTACRVAFELTDQDGAAVKLGGTVSDGDGTAVTVSAGHQGRGVFTVTPGSRRLKAGFRWQGKDYDFDLPKAEEAGVAMTLNGRTLLLSSRNLPTGRTYGLSVLCRGVLKHFRAIDFGADGRATVTLPDDLPTGVNDVTVFDNEGRIMADRLFFVNNHDRDGCDMTADAPADRTYAPYSRVDLGLACDGLTEPALFSIAVRDAATDEPTYDDGDIMTDLLLSSELRGFIASPAYYFANPADTTRSRDLDLLMMVQGWRKYRWQELADTLLMERRYTPETSLTVEGGVYKMLSVDPVEPEEIEQWRKGQGMTGRKSGEEDMDETDGQTSTDDIKVDDAREEASNLLYGNINDVNIVLGVNHGPLKREVIVEAEVAFADGVVGSAQLTHDGGRFVFEVPPFYGDAILKMKAYNEKDSLKKGMTARQDKGFADEDAFADYYVKRDLFYPVFADRYSYYQTHAPETVTSLSLTADSLSGMESDDHLLQNLDVRGKRRGKRGIDFDSPVYVADAYELYNDMTDYGLSFGKFDMRQFPLQAARLLYGNMDMYNRFNVDARIDRFTYYRNYQPDQNNPNKNWDNRNTMALYNKLKLKSLHKVKFFTDYEPRNGEETLAHETLNADVTVEMVPFADGGTQTTFRDRHIVLHGFNEPADFYQPDYSTRQPDTTTDYRRTLYWNPNAMTDSEGHFTATFFNNGKETRLKVSVAGITPDGKFMKMKNEE